MTNADKARGEDTVEVELKGKNYLLEYNMWAFCLLETETGKNALAGDLWTQPSAKDLVTLIWAGLQEHHSEKFNSIREVAKLVSMTELPTLTSAVEKAMAKASPEPEEGGSKKGKKKAGG